MIFLKNILRKIGSIFLLLSIFLHPTIHAQNTPDTSLEGFLDTFGRIFQHEILKETIKIDTQIEQYLEEISLYEGKYVDLLREIGQKFSRGALRTQEMTFYTKYKNICDESFRISLEKFAKHQESPGAAITSEQYALLNNTCYNLASQKMSAYKKAAFILALDQFARLMEYEHQQYFLDVHDSQTQLFRTMVRFLAKVSEAGNGFAFSRQVLD